MTAFRYYATADNGVHFAIHQRRRGEWAVLSAETKLDLMAGHGMVEVIEDSLAEAREHVLGRIAVLEHGVDAL